LAYITRLIELEQSIKNNKYKKYVISERSLISDKYIFERSLFKSGAINLIEHNIYKYWFNYFIEKYKTTKIIYIKASAEVCRERIIKRNRKGEENVDITYLNNCIHYHEKMLKLFPRKSILILDGNEDLKNTEKWVKQIENFIKR
jgi:deoxyadenosine/deoxycytidine kinase